jgi:hypothetical protein
MVQPTKAGIAISPALIDEVIQLLVEARTTAVAAGWTVGHVAVISTAHEHDRAAE